jgi:hypothetical protein
VFRPALSAEELRLAMCVSSYGSIQGASGYFIFVVRTKLDQELSP